jgi:hypothetical protein
VLLADVYCLLSCHVQSQKMGHDNLVAGLILQLGFLSCFMALTVYVQVCARAYML